MSAPKEFYVEENKYLKQMQEIMRGRLEVLEGGEGDRRRKEETVNRMDGGMMKRERVVNCKDSQIIRRQLLRS